MKRTALVFAAAFLLTGVVALAHGDEVHVQGTVTNITDTAITVQKANKQTQTVTINAQTMIMRGNAHLTIKDVNVGDRVVLDVDKKTSVATEMKLGTAHASSTAKASPDHKTKG